MLICIEKIVKKHLTFVKLSNWSVFGFFDENSKSILNTIPVTDV